MSNVSSELRLRVVRSPKPFSGRVWTVVSRNVMSFSLQKAGRAVMGTFSLSMMVYYAWCVMDVICSLVVFLVLARSPS